MNFKLAFGISSINNLFKDIQVKPDGNISTPVDVNWSLTAVGRRLYMKV